MGLLIMIVHHHRSVSYQYQSRRALLQIHHRILEYLVYLHSSVIVRLCYANNYCDFVFLTKTSVDYLEPRSLYLS